MYLCSNISHFKLLLCYRPKYSSSNSDILLTINCYCSKYCLSPWLLPHCSGVVCNHLQVNNGTVNYVNKTISHIGRTFEDMAVVTCEDGFRAKKRTWVAICQSDGEWLPEPVCEGKQDTGTDECVINKLLILHLSETKTRSRPINEYFGGVVTNTGWHFA